MPAHWFRQRLDRTVSHRDAVRLSAAGVLGLTLPQCLAVAKETGRKVAAKNVLVIYEQGGLPYMDTWDPKPEQVADDRSPYKPIATKVPGIQFTELLPLTCRIADKLCVVRSMHHARGGADAHPKGGGMAPIFGPGGMEVLVVLNAQGGEATAEPP